MSDDEIMELSSHVNNLRYVCDSMLTHAYNDKRCIETCVHSVREALFMFCHACMVLCAGGNMASMDDHYGAFSGERERLSL